MESRRQLLHRIALCDFALTEVTLYLDTHPSCPHALEYYQKHRQERAQLSALYTEQFGPLTILDNARTDAWGWVENPWPWELEA